MHLNRLKLAIKYRQKKVSPELVRDRFVTLLVPLVRSSPQCPTTTGLYLVRGVARLQADEHDPAGSRGLQDRAALSFLLLELHHLSLGVRLPGDEEALHQVHLQQCLVLHIPL